MLTLHYHFCCYNFFTSSYIARTFFFQSATSSFGSSGVTVFSAAVVQDFRAEIVSQSLDCPQHRRFRIFEFLHQKSDVRIFFRCNQLVNLQSPAVIGKRKPSISQLVKPFCMNCRRLLREIHVLLNVVVESAKSDFRGGSHIRCC